MPGNRLAKAEEAIDGPGAPARKRGRPPSVRRPTGRVYLLDRKRAPVWYAKYRQPGGNQVKKMLGPAWTGRGRPPAGYFAKRLTEEHQLDNCSWG